MPVGWRRRIYRLGHAHRPPGACGRLDGKPVPVRIGLLLPLAEPVAAPAARPARLDPGQDRRLRRLDDGARRVPPLPRDRRAAAQHLRLDRNRTAHAAIRASASTSKPSAIGSTAGPERWRAAGMEVSSRPANCWCAAAPASSRATGAATGRTQELDCATAGSSDRRCGHRPNAASSCSWSAPVDLRQAAQRRDASRRSSSRRGCASAPSSRTS
jgi:hypothetical protein